MLITTKIKLLPNDQQYEQLLSTMKRFNEACNRISEIVFEKKVFSKVKIQKECYYEIREQFGLSAQMVIRAIAKVAESYKVDKKVVHTFRPTGAMIYDERILSFKGLEYASILTLDGRIDVPMQISSYHRGVLEGKRVRGQADLVLIDKTFYLLLVVEIPDGTPIETTDVIGIDLGIVNLATDSLGEVFSGKKIINLRKRYARIRARLQSKGTKSAKRLLKKRSKKETRMARDINHCISKKIVEKALRHRSVIALEDLKGISKLKKKKNGKTVNKSQRAQLSNWSFYQLRQFIEYKAKKFGVPLVFVDPKHTSQTCLACGHVSKENRKTQSEFVCVSCGHADHADHNAACVIASRAAVIQPYAV